MKAFVVTSSELFRYDNWSVKFQYLLKTSRERSSDRASAFWEYVIEKGQTQAEVYRLIRECKNEDLLIDEIQQFILLGRSKHKTKQLNAADREALRDTIREIVNTYLELRRLEILASQNEVCAIEKKFPEHKP